MEFFIFTDASYDPNLDLGTGAILILTSEEYLEPPKLIVSHIKVNLMLAATIAELELKTAIWGLKTFMEEHECDLASASVHLFTDCKTVADLPYRRNKLEKNGFQSQRTMKPLRNADLYRTFFEIYESLPLTIQWIKGHHPKKGSQVAQKFFDHVDKAARRRLRDYRHTGQ